MSKEKNREEFIVKHPKHGHVVFYNPTPRQKDVLTIVQEQMDTLENVKLKIMNELDTR